MFNHLPKPLKTSFLIYFNSFASVSLLSVMRWDVWRRAGLYVGCFVSELRGTLQHFAACAVWRRVAPCVGMWCAAHTQPELFRWWFCPRLTETWRPVVAAGSLSQSNDFQLLYEVLIKFTGNQVHWKEEEMSVGRVKGQRLQQRERICMLYITTWLDVISCACTQGRLRHM